MLCSTIIDLPYEGLKAPIPVFYNIEPHGNGLELENEIELRHILKIVDDFEWREIKKKLMANAKKELENSL